MSAPAVDSAELESNQLRPIGDTAQSGSAVRPRGGTYPTWSSLDAGGEWPHLAVRGDGTEDLGAAGVTQLYMHRCTDGPIEDFWVLFAVAATVFAMWKAS